MTTLTPPQLETDELSELDFELPCDVVEWLMLGGAVVSKTPCGQVATYTSCWPCCGLRALACDHHVSDSKPWLCGYCNTETPAHRMNWTRL